MMLNKLSRNKRGNILFILSVIGFLAGITTFYIVSLFFGPQNFTNYIGEIQQSLLAKAEHAESDLVYVDQAAKYSAFQAAYDLALKGGYLSDSPCGDFGGYPIWNSKKEPCYPSKTDVERNYKFFIIMTLGKYLKNLEVFNEESYINYDIELMQRGSSLEIIGITEDRFSYPLEIKGVVSPLQTDVSDSCPVIPLVKAPLKCTSTVSCDVHSDLVSPLEKAAGIAKRRGYELVITSAYRPYAVQRDWHYNGPPGHRGDPAWMMNPTLVSRPSCTSPHTTGLAVDVTLKKDGKPVDMSDTSLSAMNNKNRRLLQEIMWEAGFVRYPKEYWHYEYGTERWEKGTKMGVRAV